MCKEVVGVAFTEVENTRERISGYAKVDVLSKFPGGNVK